MVIPCLKMAWHGDTHLDTVTLSLIFLATECHHASSHFIYSEQRATLHSSSAIFQREKKEEVTGSTQGTSIETVQALSYVSLMTLIAMFGLLSFPRLK